jgi:hypothetical protein
MFLHGKRSRNLGSRFSLSTVPSHSGVKLTTQLQLVPRSRKCGSIHPLTHTPSCRRNTYSIPLLSLHSQQPVGAATWRQVTLTTYVWHSKISMGYTARVVFMAMWRKVRSPVSIWEIIKEILVHLGRLGDGKSCPSC